MILIPIQPRQQPLDKLLAHHTSPMNYYVCIFCFVVLLNVVSAWQPADQDELKKAIDGCFCSFSAASLQDCIAWSVGSTSLPSGMTAPNWDHDTGAACQAFYDDTTTVMGDSSTPVSNLLKLYPFL